MTGRAPGTIVFAHANGFGAGTYRVLFEAWREAGWRVLAPEKVGHDPRYPVSSNWPHLRDELIDFAEAEAPGQRLHWVGHSMGGYLSLLVASRRPELAAAVVLLDSSVVAGWRAHSVQVLKATRLIERAGPGRVSQRRRPHWPTQADAGRHFAAKSVFARWDPRVLADYVETGTEPDERGGVRLAFRREVETRLYNTLPHHLGPLLKKHPPRCPVAFIGGGQSAEVRQAGMAATRAVTRGRIEWLEGTHLFPMEHPQAAAKAVLRWLATPA
ncbi:MAG: alpha/beta hydrolase [Burkholderiales bacterium]|nr:alpha/beta hydrolase [Burkholderiales bacterium]